MEEDKMPPLEGDGTSSTPSYTLTTQLTSSHNSWNRRDFLKKGDIFRTMHLPSNLIIGLDTIAMTTSKSLTGFRDIPPGAHFLWLQQPDGISRCGYWFITERQGTVRIKKWDRFHEVLAEPTAQEVRDIEASIATTYFSLQPYNIYEQQEQQKSRNTETIFNPSLVPQWARTRTLLWHTLTWAISTPFLECITGKKGVKEYLVDSTDCAKETTKDSFHQEPLFSARKPLFNSTSSEFSFSFTQDLRDLQLLDAAGSADMKASVADTTPRLLAALNNNKSTTRDILAELQFTLITGTQLSNSACLDQWWSLVLKIILRAHSLAVSHPLFARDLILTLHAQLYFTENYVGEASQARDQQDGKNKKDEGATESGSGKQNGPNADRLLYQYRPANRLRLRHALAEYKRQLRVQGVILESNLDPGNRATIIQQQEEERAALAHAWEELESWLWRCGWDLLRVEGEMAAEIKEMGEFDKGKWVDESKGEATRQWPGDSEDEDEDDMPVVVELDENGREVGLVSFRD